MTDEHATTTPSAEPSAAPTGLIDRPRRARPPLVPLWVPIAAAVVVAALVLVGGGLIYANSITQIAVPQITGIELGVARNRVASDRLQITVTERRFSGKPLDTILEQTPAPGTMVHRGDAITVVISAGTEEFSLPDVVGDGLLLARGKLEKLGLQLRVESEASEAVSDTVLATNPAPGVKVRTGDVVRITVASAGPAGSVLLPTNLKGVVVTLDPAPSLPGQIDVSLEVAHRVRSLIEASGGTVVATRSLTDTGNAAAEPARLRRAQEGSSTVAIGIDTISTSPNGLNALYPLNADSAVYAPSKTLASQIATSLVAGGLSAKSSASTTDAVLAITGAPWARVRLGSFSSSQDSANFRDPRWADSVARAIYRALAKLYGTKASS